MTDHDLWSSHSLDSQLDLLAEQDIMGRAFVEMLRRVERKVDHGGWDQPHLLFSCHRQMIDGGVGIAIGQLPAPDNEMLRGDLFAEYVLTVGDTLAEEEDVREHIFALVVVMESWMVVRPGGRKELAAFRRTYGRGDLRQEADRIETRVVIGVDTSGTAYQLMRRRDSDQFALLVDRLLGFEMGGNVTNALRQAMNKLTPEPHV